MSRITVRGAEDERDFHAFTPILQASLSFNAAKTPDFYQDVGRENFRFAIVDGHVVGGYTLYRMGHRLGGRTVPAAGIAGVAVAPEHRASGVGRALMKDALAQASRLGLPISSLFPATVPVYRRAGFEMAGAWTNHRIAPSAIDLRDDMPVLRPLTDADEPAIAACEAERSRLENGPLVRNEWLWKRLLKHPTIPIYRYGIDGPAGSGRLDGFLIHRQAPAPDAGSSIHYEIIVRDWAALTPAAGRRLLSFLAAHRSFCNSVQLPGKPADPLLLQLKETPVAIDRRLFWMLRVVDVKAALEARGYPTGLTSRVTLDVKDDGVAANNGRFTLSVDGGRATVKRGGSDRRGGVRIDVRGLASLYTSHQTPTDLVRAGLFSGSDRDLATLATLFAGPAPWIVEIF